MFLGQENSRRLFPRVVGDHPLATRPSKGFWKNIRPTSTDFTTQQYPQHLHLFRTHPPPPSHDRSPGGTTSKNSDSNQRCIQLCITQPLPQWGRQQRLACRQRTRTWKRSCHCLYQLWSPAEFSLQTPKNKNRKSQNSAPPRQFAPDGRCHARTLAAPNPKNQKTNRP